MGGGAWRGACSPAAPTGRTAPARAGDPPPLGPRAGRGTRLGRCRACHAESPGQCQARGGLGFDARGA